MRLYNCDRILNVMIDIRQLINATIDIAFDICTMSNPEEKLKQFRENVLEIQRKTNYVIDYMNRQGL